MSIGETARRSAAPWREIYPLCLLAAVYSLLNVGVFPFNEWIDLRSFDDQMMFVAAFVGMLCGQACTIVILAALTRRTWIGGYYLGLLLLSLGYAALLLGGWSMDNLDTETLVGFCWLPGFLLVAAGPLYCLRLIRGWRLTHRAQAAVARQPFRLGDIFSLTAIAAAAIVLMRAPQVLLEEDLADYWIPIAVSCSILFGVGLLILPPCVRLALGTRSRVTSVLGLLAVAFVATWVLFAIMQCFYAWDASWDERLEIAPFLLCGMSCLFGTFCLSLLMLAATGWKLTRSSKQAVVEQQSRPAIATYWRVIAAICVAIAVSIALARLEQWRRLRDAQLDRLLALAEELGGYLHSSEREANSLILGEQAQDGDLGRFRELWELTYIDISDSRITDVGLADLRYFPKLTAFIANETEITDAGLVHLQSASDLVRLELNGTRIQGSGLRHVAPSLSWLSAARTPIDDRGCESLSGYMALENVYLAGTRIGEHGLRHLAALPRLHQLDLSDTPVAWSQTRGFPVLWSLDLSGTPNGDKNIAMLQQLPKLAQLQIARTRITDAAFEDASWSQLTSLNISETAASDTTIEHLASSQITWLDASKTQITGSGFAKWSRRRDDFVLRLSGTVTTDKNLAHLIPLAPFDELDLSDTSVTDAGLAHLGMMGIESLDLSHAKVTAPGLLADGLLGISKLRLAQGQFSTQEVQQLKQRLSCTVEVVEEPAEEETE